MGVSVELFNRFLLMAAVFKYLLVEGRDEHLIANQMWSSLALERVVYED
jgi:hypothetical protein